MISKFKWTLALFMVLFVQISFAQVKTLTGVVSEGGMTLPGVSVIIKGTQEGTQTDLDGKYSIQVKPGDVLEFSFIGMNNKSYTVGNATTYNVEMTYDDGMLEEVVVVAYGTATKESVTGAISVVKSDDITKRSSSNAVSALEGAFAGIQVNNTSGQPGSEPEVRIRGFTSLKGEVKGVDANAPLYVVDGVPYGGNISDINPADIESMSVLKDASSTTLYGNRASNGVIMITTKKGSKAGVSFNVDMKQGVYTRGIKDYDRIGPDDFMNVMYEGYRNSLLTGGKSFDEATALANSGLIKDFLGLNIYDKPADQLFENGQLRSDAQILEGYKSDLDWYKPIERTGYFQDINMNGRIANEKGGAYFSTGFLNNEGYFKKSDFKRFTGRLNADYNVNDWLKVGANISGSHQVSNGVPADRDNTNNFTNPFMFARNIAPIYPVHLHNADGSFVRDESGNRVYDDGTKTRNQFKGRHNIWENELNSMETIRNTMNAQVFADIKFLEDFTFSIRGDLNTSNAEDRKYENAIIGDGSGTIGRGRRDIRRYKTYTAQQLLNWNKDLGNHNLQVLLGHENYSTERSTLYAIKSGETFAGLPDFVNFSETTNLLDYTDVYRTEGYFSRVKYNYDNKYFVEGSFRRDGSSKFHKDNRWGNFWSVGGSYIISNENWFQSSVIDNLKVRASYGEVGNDQGVDWYAYQDLYAIVKNGGKPGAYRSQNGNKDLKWETSSSFGAAVETRLFNRMNLSVEYFDKRSQNLLIDFNLPLSTGSTSTGSAEALITRNVGVITNKGIEVAFDIDIINNHDLRWNFGANATWLKNKVASLPAENREAGIVRNDYQKIAEGKSVFEFYLYQYAGVDQMTGNALYELDTDVYTATGEAGKKQVEDQYLAQIGDKYYTTYTTYARRDWSGSALPKVNGSFNTSLSYKNFSLSALFTYSIGGKVYDTSYSGLMNVTSNPSALHKDILGSWTGAPEGMTETSPNRIDPNGTPVMDFDRSSYTSGTYSDRWLKDASYLVFKNISLSYEMPKETMEKMGINGLRFTAGVENVLTFTKRKGMNPQQTYNGILYDAYVTPRTYTFGINVAF
ncbi:SusC/RagA family TonB-linked outer membrane protein [Myroides sp. BIT-d1]|uniref:SusC/RagA family TonB-linked outer membrane protein n=1 Tax=Myroides albus TaxID=2562892 RepID=A0A6I3LQ46_9FLAO|nr:TonB-dependent receptor [Myroides albus]MTG98781.1 SusC/RagA family TonB-linked outer membrane protein [Myroides albus]